MSQSLFLQVGSLPSNRLALTNRVYISNSNFSLFESFGGGQLLVSLGSNALYVAEGHSSVPDDQIALNGLQRRFCQFSLNTRTEVKKFNPPPNFALASLEFSVDLLTKRSSGSHDSRARPREIDTDKLAIDVLTLYEEHVFTSGQLMALDFEGTKLELAVANVSVMTLGDETTDVINSDKSIGQLLGPTEIRFRKGKGSKLVALDGSKVSGTEGGGNSIFLGDFDFEKLGIGGLDSEFNKIFRRAFASRIWPSHIIKQIGIMHVRGMLLHGPPGCGKTLIARQIGKVLNAREPKIVNGPEILNKFVGGSEEKIRELFADAEKEQIESGDASMLHIIILDEMDAICKSRGTVSDGTGVSDSVVNQLLSKIDGVDSLNNILLIGMTNRKDMIDDALLRPGRLEVHVEIGLPDTKGRSQILNIHTKNMRESNRITPEVIQRMDEIAENTKNFSGAELEGLVKAATSYALTRCVDVNDLSKVPDATNLILKYEDFQTALNDVEPKFGVKSQELKTFYRNGFVPYGEKFDSLMSTMERLVEQVRSSDKTPLMSVLLQGQVACGKSAIAAKVAVSSGFPFVRLICADEMIGYSESSKCQKIHKVFLDSYKSPLSLIFIDDIERIIDYVPIGPRFSNLVLQTLLVLLKKSPPENGRKLLVIGTTSVPHFLDDLGLVQAFSVSQSVGLLDEPNEIAEVLQVAAQMSITDAGDIAAAISKPVGIKHLLMVAEMARQNSKSNEVGVSSFLECLHTAGY